MAAMKDHLNPRPIVIAERYKFHQRAQKDKESVAQYLAALRKLVEKVRVQGISRPGTS